MSDPTLPPVLDPDELRGLGEHRLADVRWYLDGRSGYEAYRAGHRPGAVFVDLDRWLAAPAHPQRGRHPLPDPEVFAEGMSACGIGDQTPVVAYDDLGGMVAARLVWMLRALGHPAALLDGGLDGELETGEVSVPPARFTPRPWPGHLLVDADQLAAELAGGASVIDARAPERYRGETEPVDARAGHIPGALNRPFVDNLDGGRFRSPDELAQIYAGLSPEPIVYCGSGVSACHDLLAMERAGIEGARLYPGSWSQWSADPIRPVATGEAP